MPRPGRPKKEGFQWDSINGKLDRQITIRTNNYYDKLLFALQSRMKVSQGEIFRQGLQLLSIQWQIDPYENEDYDPENDEKGKYWWLKHEK